MAVVFCRFLPYYARVAPQVTLMFIFIEQLQLLYGHIQARI
jgi:hypothetical protein